MTTTQTDTGNSSNKTSKTIHFTGYPCKVDKGRWKSSMLSSNSNPDKVTCKACIKQCLRIAIAWKSKANKQKKLEAEALKVNQKVKQKTTKKLI
ncbi:MAG TPA: hypothetical protein VIQ31_00465 [Phormidium sp.]